MKTAVATLSFLLVASGLVESKWDGLKVTWGTNPFKVFTTQPRTVEEATAQGYEIVDSGVCGESNYNGIAYAKGGDYGLTLLFDKNGFIAGIQVGVTNDQKNATGYPSDKISPPFVLDGDTNTRMVYSAYFTDPSKICTEGRTQAQFDQQGTGTGLWLQTGETADEVTKIPMEEGDVEAPWVEGKCFKTMGKHYWHGISSDMDCQELYPAFLLYNQGKLNSFGWSLFAHLPSPHFEHPGANVFGFFMEKVPKCLADSKPISTMHIYMTDAPWTNWC